MNKSALRSLLQRLQAGEVALDDALARLAPLRTAATSDSRIDLDRPRRCGFPEVVFCQGKTAAAVVEIFETLVAHGQEPLGTRISAEQADALRQRFPNAIHNPIGRTVRIALSHVAPSPPKPTAPPSQCDAKSVGLGVDAASTVGHVAVITAGTSDRPVAEEAIETLRWMRCGVELITDVGVAGPHRLIEQLSRFADADAVVVAAGMEGALPSVVGGHVPCPVIAVPTSVGYGASFGGIAALLGMLNSCAANVVVVNIDAGFKAGYVAGLIARRRTASDDPV